MDWLDRIALSGRRYERLRSVITGSTGHHLGEVLQVFRHKTIFELEVRAVGELPRKSQHKLGRPLSLVDAVAEIDGSAGSSFEILATAPSGDYARVRIISHPAGGSVSMLVGERLPEHHLLDDRLMEELHTSHLRWNPRRSS